MANKDKDKESSQSIEPDLTIVGGQPHGRKRQASKVKVPVGLEKVLFCAAANEDFRRRLMEDRSAAIEESRINLRPSERAMLELASDADLSAMIDRIDARNPKKRKFMNLVAAAVTSLAAGTVVVSGCEHTSQMGVDPGTDVDTDVDTDTDSDSDTDMDAGDSGDTDTVDTDTETFYADAGVGPDDSGV